MIFLREGRQVCKACTTAKWQCTMVGGGHRQGVPEEDGRCGGREQQREEAEEEGGRGGSQGGVQPHGGGVVGESGK